ncbi:hypothetical protein TNCT_619791 [Trichonephila clavata]|uniref:Uncharacterized protein n=1 Tax=Trichonephila clavata TaxID=2740835 RepID=A0A8X6L1R5_TRICU|nr:hypothetical protein TNCT_619791 [Trichonephila clavata]
MTLVCLNFLELEKYHSRKHSYADSHQAGNNLRQFHSMSSFKPTKRIRKLRNGRFSTSPVFRQHRSGCRCESLSRVHSHLRSQNVPVMEVTLSPN